MTLRNWTPRSVWMSTLAVTAWCVIAFGGLRPLAADEQDEPAKVLPTENEEYQLPEGGAEELTKFIEKLQGVRPRSVRQLQTLQGRIVEAADKILDDEAAGEEAELQAVQAKFQSLSLLQRYGDESAAEKIEQLRQALKDDPRPAMQREFVFLDFASRYDAARTPSGDSLELLDDVLAYLEQGELDQRLFGVFRGIVRTVEYSGETEKAAGAFQKLAAAAAQSDIKSIADYAPKLEGAARRLRLIGNPMEIEGVTVAGEPFDWEAYRGKVVLIDFWATWCGPCIRELPNVEKQYQLYHDKGFDVVGISLDGNRDALVKFIEDREIPWTTLHGDSEETRGWDHPTAVYYGVMAIPTVILIDQEGNVVSLRARGDSLGTHLRELLGPPTREPVEAQKPVNVADAGN